MQTVFIKETTLILGRLWDVRWKNREIHCAKKAPKNPQSYAMKPKETSTFTKLQKVTNKPATKNYPKQLFNLYYPWRRVSLTYFRWFIA